LPNRPHPLPIDPLLPAVVAAIRGHRALVLVAEPGAGKTTRVPPAILRAGLLTTDHPALVLLQPRRVAARAAAARIAEENGWAVGREVGYQVRFERRIGPETRLRVVTEGILTRQLLADPFLEGVGAVVLDEFHERSLHTDLALALLREVREAVRADLILIVMSATLDAGPVAQFLGNCPILRVPGRTFPVAIEHAPPSPAPLPGRVAAAVARAVEGDAPGDVLVFLPGVEEIRRSARELEPLAARAALLVLPLHGRLPAEDQDRALRPAPAGLRKVILATNVAETSLTIDGVGTVIDSGLARFAGFDPARGLDRLELGRISRASAAQRAGRAGRTGPGRCVRLWSPREGRGMPEFDAPEVRRVDLCATVLALRSWGHIDPARFPWFEPPPAGHLAGAERLLAMLGAVEAEGGPITPIGRRLLAWPVHPRLGRLLDAAAGQGALRAGAALAALLSERDLVLPRGPEAGPRRADPVARGRSDLLVRLDALNEAERRRFAPGLRDSGIDPRGARQVVQVANDLLRSVRRDDRGRGEPGPSFDDETLLRLVLLAYPDRVARRRAEGGPTAVMVGGRGVRLEPGSVVREAEFFLALDPRDDRRGGATEARVGIASEVQLAWIEEAFPGAIRRERAARYDEERGRVVGLNRLWYRDLILREDAHAAVDPAEAGAALAEALAPRAREFVRQDEAAAAWLDRLDCLRGWMPEAAWPELADAELAEVVAGACQGKRTLDEVRRVPILPPLKAEVPYSQALLMDELAPETIVVPSGNRIRLTYEPGRPPVLAVRLQELFGWAETPRVAGGRVPVLLHLLGPNFRPVQVTDDLRSFWSNAYFQVRKDLRSRYPKHSWPEDPRDARPEARGGRRSP